MDRLTRVVVSTVAEKGYSILAISVFPISMVPILAFPIWWERSLTVTEYKEIAHTLWHWIQFLATCMIVYARIV